MVNGYPVVAVSIGNEQFIGLRKNPHVCRTIEILCVGIPFALITVAHLHDEFAVLRELQQLVITDLLQSGRLQRAAVIAVDPDVTLTIDVDSRPLRSRNER